MTAHLAAIEGKYEILEKIREGGMGAIYRVRHRLLEDERVVKVMRPQLEGDDSFAARFQREAQAASRLRHPNIAQLFDFHIGEGGTAFIVMEYIRGIDLRHLVRDEHPPALATVLAIAVQSLDALAMMHAKGIVHRDVSPDNLMVTDDGHGGLLVKLIDLGIAKVMDSDKGLTKDGEFLGKIQYASPEHFGGTDGEHTVDPRSDIYSFGIVLYELLTQRKPYHGTDFSSITSAHLFQPPLDFSETDPGGRIPESLRSIVLKALEKRPDHRYADAGQFRDALAAVLVGIETEVESATEILTMVRRPAAGVPGDERGGEAEAGTDPAHAQDRLDEVFPPVATPPHLPSRTPGPDTERSWEQTAKIDSRRPAAREAPRRAAEKEAPPPPQLPPAPPRPVEPSRPTAAPKSPSSLRSTLLIGGLVVLVAVGAVAIWEAFQAPPERPPVAELRTPSPTGEGGVESGQESAVAAEGADPIEEGGDAAADLEEELPLEEEPPLADATGQDQELLLEMTETYSDLVRAESSPQAGPADRAEAWRRFLALYAADLESTDADERMRSQAERRRVFWEQRAAAAAETAEAQATAERPRPAPTPVEPETDPAQATAGQQQPQTNEPTTATKPPQPPPISDPVEARQALARRGVEVTPESLRAAAGRGDRERVRLLLLAGVERDDRDSSKAVRESLAAGDLGMATLLLDSGVELRSHTGALEDAAMAGARATIDYLLDRGMGDADEALEECLDNGRWQMAKYLIDRRATTLSEAMDEAEDLLIEAAEDGDLDAVRWLLSAGVDARSSEGEEALSEARDNGHLEIVALLEQARGAG